MHWSREINFSVNYFLDFSIIFLYHLSLIFDFSSWVLWNYQYLRHKALFQWKERENANTLWKPFPSHSVFLLTHSLNFVLQYSSVDAQINGVKFSFHFFLSRMRWKLTVGFICISLVAKDEWTLFILVSVSS